MKKMSEICREAANERLWDGVGNDDVYEFCCVAIKSLRTETRARSSFLLATGAPESGSGFNDLKTYEERQGARYMLLLFASYYFEDIGQ